MMLSPQEYDRLHAANIAEFLRFCDRITERATARRLTQGKIFPPDPIVMHPEKSII